MVSDFHVFALVGGDNNPELSHNYRITPVTENAFPYTIYYRPGLRQSLAEWHKLREVVNEDKAVSFVLDDIYSRWIGKPIHCYDLNRILTIWKEGANEVGIFCDPAENFEADLREQIKILISFTELIKIRK